LLVQQVSVVGVPCLKFGEVPVAILDSLVSRVENPSGWIERLGDDGNDAIVVEKRSISKQDVITSVPFRLGADYMLAEVFTLAELKLDRWPLNSTGKLDKRALRSLIVCHKQE
jgi:acyl-CoA synthetase (AMP-forming)/AMP-acid ligase II